MPSNRENTTSACYEKLLRRSQGLKEKKNNRAESILRPGRDGRSPSNRKNKSDNTKVTIFDLNEYCLEEILRYLTVRDLMALEMSSSYFGPFCSKFYARHSIEIDMDLLEAYPDWLWTKIGKHFVDLTLNYIRTKNDLDRALSYFPNVERLTCYNSIIYNVPNLPKDLKYVKLTDCKIRDRCDEYFRQIASTLTEIKLDCTDYCKTSLHPLNHIKSASFRADGLSQYSFAKFLKNNRGSLESLDAYHATRGNALGTRCYENLQKLHKLTALRIILDRFTVSRLTATFRAQIKCLSLRIPDDMNLTFEDLHSFTQLECLELNKACCDDLVTIYVSMPTLKSITLDSYVSLEEFIGKLKPCAQFLKRKITIFVQGIIVS